MARQKDGEHNLLDLGKPCSPPHGVEDEDLEVSEMMSDIGATATPRNTKGVTRVLTACTR